MSSDIKIIEFRLNNKEFRMLYTTPRIIRIIDQSVYMGWTCSTQESETE
jgi:hypothetical protein